MAKKNQPAKPTKAPKEKREKSGGRIDFPKIGNKDEKIYPFDSVMPPEFDFKTHKTLKKKDFTADHLYFSHRAAEARFKAEQFDAQAEEAKKLGSAKDRGKAKRLIKLTEKMAELKEQLAGQGIDVEKLLADSAKEE